MNALHELQELGQSVWYDGLRRALLDRGQFARYLERYAVRGVTSNPTVFERAIWGSDYDDALRDAIDEGGIEDAEEVFWRLALRDIQDATDLLRGVHDDTEGADGFASLELPPRLSHDTDGLVRMATDLFERLDRPNAMIAVPGTSEGVPAVEELIYRGINVNVTLLFSLTQWEAVAEAYARGLERRLDDARDLDVASVASFFVSRIDVKANERLPQRLRNRLGVANGHLTYAAYRGWLSSDRWKTLAEAGARPQRLTWATTSTKDPQLSETFYVTALVAPDTIATLPEQTMLAFATAGKVGEPLSQDASEAEGMAAEATQEGVDLEELGRELQEEGERKSAEAFDRLRASVESKAAQLRGGPRPTRQWLDPVANTVEAVLDDLKARDALQRLWKRDHTLWQDDPAGVADRLGWLVVPQEMEEKVQALRAFADKAASDGLTDALLLGMGGSSLFPLVVADTFGTAEGALKLHVLDSVDPGAIRRVQQALPLDRSLVLASSKSGTTLETCSLLAWLWDRSGEPDRFVVITDPGTPLAELGYERGFRGVFETRPDIGGIGGRYSALSHFGLVPAALAGVDIAELLHRAGRVSAACADCVSPEANPALRLGAILAGSTRAGRDKLTLVVDERIASFALWIEQLIAESTGKQDTGIVPVVGEPLGAPDVYGDDRLFVAVGDDAAVLDPLVDAGHPALMLDLDELVDLGAEVLRWEIATALTGAALRINPFDQPDVEAAKDATRRALHEGVPKVELQPLQPLLDRLGAGDYLAIQAFVDPEADVVADLERARVALRDRYGVATTLGFGPRYLHSTGQLHKGGPNSGVFVQVVGEDEDDPPIPGEQFGFSTLKWAQAAGDLQALKDRGRRVARVTLDELVEVGG